MWTETTTLLTLSEWAREINIHPLILSQVGEPRAALGRDLETDAHRCQDIFYQFAWQTGDRLGREEVGIAIRSAEDLIAKVAGTYPAPKERSDIVMYPRAANLAFGQLWYGDSGRLKSIKAEMGNIQSTGLYTEDIIEANVAVTGSDPLTQGFNTRFSLSVTVDTGTTADEIAVFFNSVDRRHYPLEQMEIRPIEVNISGNTATITGDHWLLIKPENYWRFVPEELNATTAGIYATTVDVYRRTIDLDQSGSLIWELSTYTPGVCEDPPCSFEMYSGCFVPTNPRLGYVAPLPAEYDAATEEYSLLCPCQTFAPDRVALNYISGASRLDNGLMAQPWRKITALLATALLPNRNCGCSRADLRLFHYRQPPFDDNGNIEVSQAMFESASAAFGVSGRGAVQAYELLMGHQELRIGRSVNA